MSTVKEKKEKKRKYSIKEGDSERHGIKKHSLALNLRP